ncbi:MAG: hypothetical protein V3S01_10670 [Dehalococcoidia bacterium]
MSYARHGGDSDVYLIATTDSAGWTGWQCLACRLTEKVPTRYSLPWYQDTYMDALREVLAHLKAHRAAGHKVPRYAIDRVRRELGLWERTRWLWWHWLAFRAVLRGLGGDTIKVDRYLLTGFRGVHTGLSWKEARSMYMDQGWQPVAFWRTQDGLPSRWFRVRDDG